MIYFRYLLVDFGLAHIINNKQNRNINTGTKRKREASPVNNNYIFKNRIYQFKLLCRLFYLQESEVSGKPTKRTYMTDSLNGTTECVNKTSQKENYPQQHKISGNFISQYFYTIFKLKKSIQNDLKFILHKNSISIILNGLICN